MSADFLGKHVVITGGTRGIGRAVAQRLATEGAHLSLNYASRSEDAERTVNECRQAGGQAVSISGNVADPGEARRIASDARDAFGPIAMLVHSAGTSFPMPADEVTWEVWKKTLDVNLDGTFNMVYAVKDEMLKQSFGRIVTVSSIAGLRERQEQLPYSVSKAGVIALTRCLAEAWGPHNVRVNCVCPGLTETEMAYTLSKEMREKIVAATPLRRVGQPEEIAALVRFLLSEESSYMTGQTVISSGGRVMLPG